MKTVDLELECRKK